MCKEIGTVAEAVTYTLLCISQENTQESKRGETKGSTYSLYFHKEAVKKQWRRIVRSNKEYGTINILSVKVLRPELEEDA